jgi:hypothetical protein
VRQGDPISPLLFDLVVDALPLIRSGHIHGVIPHLLPGGITHLKYADETMILIQKDDMSVTNLKFLLFCFKLLSGLKINYHKSEVIVMGSHHKSGPRWHVFLTVRKGSSPSNTLDSQ